MSDKECIYRTREMLWIYHLCSTVTLVDLTKEYQEELPVANLGRRFTPYCMLRLWADRVEGLPDRSTCTVARSHFSACTTSWHAL